MSMISYASVIPKGSVMLGAITESSSNISVASL